MFLDKYKMTSDYFTPIVNFILQHEGGYVNDPDDPGGETNFGISKASYPNLDIKNLKQIDAIEIYRRDYWDEEWEKLGFPLAACMMDTSVNMGKARANNFLKGCGGNYVLFLQMRIAKYKDLISNNSDLAKFQKGWMNRVTDLRRFIDGEKDSFGTNPFPPAGGSLG